MYYREVYSLQAYKYYHYIQNTQGTGGIYIFLEYDDLTQKTEQKA